MKTAFTTSVLIGRILFLATGVADAGEYVVLPSVSGGETLCVGTNQPLTEDDCRSQNVIDFVETQTSVEVKQYPHYLSTTMYPTACSFDWRLRWVAWNDMAVSSPSPYMPLRSICWCPSCETLPTVAPAAGAGGDPHFKTWAGQKYDFHGICDLILLQNEEFKDVGMDVHVRTKQVKQWAYISNVAVHIGKDTLEVSTGKDGSINYWINGVAGEELNVEDHATTVAEHSISGYPVAFQNVHSKQTKCTVDLGEEEQIEIKNYKHMLSVKINKGSMQNFNSSLGMMGTYPEGKMIGRDKDDVMDDPNDFGQEWQVRGTDPKLFHSIEGPQHPMQKCSIPSALATRRNLREGGVTQEQAELVCATVPAADRDVCVFDVMATGDIDAAGAY